MLSRRHIRIKIMQTLFAYYIADGTQSKAEAIKELKKSLGNIYKLYIHLFSFLVELFHFVDLYDDNAKTLYIPSAQDINANKKFYSGTMSTILQEDENLESIMGSEQNLGATEQIDISRTVLLNLKNHEPFKDYMASTGRPQGRDSA